MKGNSWVRKKHTLPKGLSLAAERLLYAYDVALREFSVAGLNAGKNL